MAYSTIRKKKCKCSENCKLWPSVGYGGFAASHAPKEILDKVGTKRQVQKRNKNARNRAALLLKKEVIVPAGAEMKRWFDERRKEMTGHCWHCGGRSLKDNDQMFHYSIAHLLPKAYFKSVAKHPLNWIELCFYGKSCHTNFDNKMLDIIELNCFDEVIKRFVSMYPDIAPEERRRIPTILLQYLETEK